MPSSTIGNHTKKTYRVKDSTKMSTTKKIIGNDNASKSSSKLARFSKSQEASINFGDSKSASKTSSNHLSRQSSKHSSKSSAKSTVKKSSHKDRRGAIPPPAPMPPRLETPELSDLEGENFPTYSSISKMEQKLAAAKLYQLESRSRAAMTPQRENQDARSLKLETGNERRRE